LRKVPGYFLWIGHAGDLADPRPILDAGIEAVVELADSEPFATLPRSLIRCRFPVSDDGENRPEWLRSAIFAIAELVRLEIPTLVACSAGMSRSVLLASAAIASASAEPFADVLRQLTTDGPVDLSPALADQVHQIVVGLDGDSSRPRRADGNPRQAS
jgi:hypothetical protein